MKSLPLVYTALLLAAGAVLNAIMPGFLGGMTPDMVLTMMFLSILLFANPRNIWLAGLGAGVISALTTTFPGGQIPNFIEKPITAFIFFGLFTLIFRKSRSTVSAAILTAVGAMVSGCIFLALAFFVAGLPGGASFIALFVAVVLPAATIDTVIMIIIHPIALSVKKRSNWAEAA